MLIPLSQIIRNHGVPPGVIHLDHWLQLDVDAKNRCIAEAS